MDKICGLARKRFWIEFRKLRGVRDKIAFMAQFQLDASPEILDVGCGNNSSFSAKSILPSCIYTGIDVGDYNQTKPNMADKYIVTSPENFSYEISKFKNHFDAVISSHNIEHCDDREKTIKAMLDSIKPGGQLFISFPCENSVNFPKRGGTLNYFDDPTHTLFPPNFTVLIETLEKADFKIEFAAKRYRPFLQWLRGFINEKKSRDQNLVFSETWSYY